MTFAASDSTRTTRTPAAAPSTLSNRGQDGTPQTRCAAFELQENDAVPQIQLDVASRRLVKTISQFRRYFRDAGEDQGELMRLHGSTILMTDHPLLLA